MKVKFTLSNTRLYKTINIPGDFKPVVNETIEFDQSEFRVDGDEGNPEVDIDMYHFNIQDIIWYINEAEGTAVRTIVLSCNEELIPEAYLD